jgi:hypothetical protein
MTPTTQKDLVNNLCDAVVDYLKSKTNELTTQAQGLSDSPLHLTVAQVGALQETLKQVESIREEYLGGTKDESS